LLAALAKEVYLVASLIFWLYLLRQSAWPQFLTLPRMQNESLDRLSALRASCKHWSAFLTVVIVLACGLGKLSPKSVILALVPVLLLGLMDAAYAAQQECRVDSDCGAEEPQHSSPSAKKGSRISRAALATFSFSIWPFYLTLLSVVAIAGFGLSSEGLSLRQEHASAPRSHPEVAHATVTEPMPVQMTLQTASDRSAGPLQAVPGNFAPRMTPGGVRRSVVPVNYAAKPGFQPAISPPTGGEPLRTSSIPSKSSL
jgi:hypothetical protein